jgi:hypothetical protein
MAFEFILFLSGLKRLRIRMTARQTTNMSSSAHAGDAAFAAAVSLM